MPALTHAQTEELACTYAALILHDAHATISAENINALTQAAGVKVAPYWPKVFASAFEKRSIGDFLAAGPAAGGAAPAAAPVAAAVVAPVAKKEEPKKEEKKEESDEDMGFGLFD